MHGLPPRNTYFGNIMLDYSHHYFGYKQSGYHQSTSLRQQRKKSRDSARMTAFLNRKDAENLPFYQVEDTGVLCFNSLVRDNLVHLNARINHNVAVAESSQSKSDRLHDTVTALQESEQYLQHKTNVQTRLISKLRDQIQELERQTEIYRNENIQLSDQCSVQEITLETSKGVIATLNLQNNHLENGVVYQQQNKIEGLETIIHATEKELKNLTTEILNLKYPNRLQQHGIMIYACKQCSSNVYHKQHECPALGTKCELCDETDHLTIACATREEFILPVFVQKQGPYGL